MEESIKGPGAALEARKCFDNIICAAPAGICPLEMAVIDVTAKHPDFSVVSPPPHHHACSGKPTCAQATLALNQKNDPRGGYGQPGHAAVTEALASAPVPTRRTEGMSKQTQSVASRDPCFQSGRQARDQEVPKRGRKNDREKTRTKQK